MFGGLVTVAAVCVALAFSGWQPPDLSTYQDYPNAPLISYDQAQLEWYYHVMKNEMAEWFLFVDDRKLIGFESADIYTCRCSGTYSDVYSPTYGDPDGQMLPKLFIQINQGLRGSGIDLYRLTLLVDRIPSKTIFSQLRDLLQSDGSAISLPSGKTPHSATLILDGKLMFLTLLLQIAILACKRHFDKKNEGFNKPEPLTMTDMENYERDILRLSFQPVYHDGKSIDEDLYTNKFDNCTEKPESDELEVDNMFSWSSGKGFSSNWYKITPLKDNLSTSDIEED